MRTRLAVLVVALIGSLSVVAYAQETKVILDEDFSGNLPQWGLPAQGGTLKVSSGPIVVPVFNVSDATVEYRTRVDGSGLIEFMFRCDLDNDDYYIFRVDTRGEGGNAPELAPGFLKRNHGTPPWVLVGERTGNCPLPNTWVKVKVEVSGNTFRGYLDDKLVATLQDDDFKAGGFAFRSQVADAEVDDLRISVPAGAKYTLLQPPPVALAPAPAPYTEGIWSASWIWSPGADNDLTRVLRKSFEAQEAVQEATVAVTCDNGYELYLNGKLVGQDHEWESVETYDVKGLLRQGKNEFAAYCINDAPGAAGLLLEFGATTVSGKFVHVVSDETWKASKTKPEGWQEIGFDDSAWEQATVAGKQPCAPWATQHVLRLPYLGPKQPLELVSAQAPAAVIPGKPFRITATWRPVEPLTAEYPIVLTATQEHGRPMDLAILKPATPMAKWQVGAPHTETLEVTLLPDAGYLMGEGPVALGLEVRGTLYVKRADCRIGTATVQAPALTSGPPPPRVVAAQGVKAGKFTDPTGPEHAWHVGGDGMMVIDGKPMIPLDADGVYWCDAASAGGALAALDWKPIVANVCARGGPSGADFTRVRLVDHVDATKDDHEFSDDSTLGGMTRIMHIGDRDYRVSSARNHMSYMAFTATCEHPRNPHLMMFQSVNDRERYTTIRVQPPWDNVGGGAYTGREYPCDGKPFEQRFLFYPREKRIRFTVSRMPVEKEIQPESGAAVSHVWLFELVGALAARPVRVAKPAGPERRLGMYLTHPPYMYSLYGFPGSNPEEQSASLRSFVDYLKYCGLNLLEFNAVDGGDTTGVAFYKSDIWPNGGGDLLARLLPLGETNDIQILPVITSLSVPEGKFGFTKDSMQMDRYSNLTVFFNSRPPLPDPLRPEVQALVIKNLREILAECAKSPAVPGIGVRINGKIGLCYGGETLGASDQYTGYSKWDVAEFTKDTGIAVPDQQPTPYEWIHANCWEKWLDWRCQRIHQFWLKCRDVVREYRPDLVLYLSCDMPSETPAWNIYWPKGETPLNCMRYHGLDPRMYANDRGILLQRGMMVAADRYFTRVGQYGTNVEAMKDFHYAPGVTEMYNGSEGNACELYHNYWEESGVIKNGEFQTNFWGAATMYPFGRNYFEPIAFSLAKTNCHTLNLFSWERGTFGHEHDLRAFARAFRALPRSEGDAAEGLVIGDAKGLWVRRFGNRIAVLNTAATARTVRLKVPAGKAPMEYGRWQRIIPAGGEVDLGLEAYELRVVGQE